MNTKHKSIILSICIVFLIFPAASVYACGPKKSARILIVRDNYGVPHVFANTKEGLAFGCGYAMAQDRLWQADLFRRMSFGSLAEFGLASIYEDYATRSLGYSREELGEIFDKWNPINPKARLKEMFLAYVDGVNQYISEAKNDISLLPVEYLAYGVPLEPFTIEDCVAIVVMMAWRFGGTGGNELGYAAAFNALLNKYSEDPDTAYAIFNDLYPQFDPGAEVTIPEKGYKKPKCSFDCAPFLPSNIISVYESVEKIKAGQTKLYESLGLPTKFGSNAWVVNGKKSETRNAMQVGGPQMGHTIPQIVLEVGLHGAGINAVGMMMPHAPSILIGASEYGAWTSTTGSSDIIDTYIEELNSENQYQYWYKGAWRDMEVRIESFYNKTGHKFDFPVYRTIHGPIVAWDPSLKYCYTIKSPYYKNELAAEEGWSLFQQARNIHEFQKAVKTVQPSHNFLWADRYGNIGFWHAGTFPIKPATGKDGRPIDDRFPLWGTGEEEWIGLTGFKEMPKAINPKQGYLANWNNKPITNWPYSEADWGEGHRVKRIQDLLDEDNKVSYEDMNRINIDAGYNHIPGMNLLDDLIEAAKNVGGVPTEVIDYLEAWDHHYNDIEDPKWPDAGLGATYDDPGLTIFDAWHARIYNEIFADDLPPGYSAGISTLIHVFDGPDSKLTLQHDYLNGEVRDEVIVRALKEALTYLESKYGADIKDWTTNIRTVTFDQLGAHPAPTMHAMNRGTYNQIVEMPRRSFQHWWCTRNPNAMNVIPPGQSGFMNYLQNPHPHAYDQLPLYESWTYKPMLFTRKDVFSVGESWIYLSYN